MTKLLPLEYCKLDRAAQLLECEVEDLIHWGAIWAIDLCLRLNDANGYVIDNRSIEKKTFQLFSGRKYFDISNGLATYSREDQQYIKCATVDAYMAGEAEAVSTSDTNVLDGEAEAVSTSDTNVLDGEGGAICEGFWVFPHSELCDMEYSPNNNHRLYGYHTFYAGDDDQRVFAEISFPDDGLFIEPSDLWITRKNLEKLHLFLNGKEKLPNRFNTEDLAKLFAEQQVNERQEKGKTRETALQAKMIKALIQAVVGKDARLDKPYKLADTLTAALSAKGIECPIKTGDTLKRLLEKAGGD